MPQAHPRAANQILPEVPLELEPMLAAYLMELNQRISQLFLTFDPPSLVEGVTVEANNAVNVLRWNAAANAALYRVWRNTSGDLATAEIVGLVPASKTGVSSLSFQDAQDEATATRYYWIQGVNERGVPGIQSQMVSTTNFRVSATGTALGTNAVATGTQTTALGIASNASGDFTLAAGYNSSATAANSVSLGQNSATSATRTVGIGSGATVSNTESIGVGRNVSVTGDYSTALGDSADVSAESGIALGRNTVISAARGIGLGGSITVGSTDAIAVGFGSSVSAANQVRFGAGASTWYFNDMSIFMGANGQQFSIREQTEETTIDAAAFTDTAIQIPADAVVLGVSVRVTTVIPTATTFDVGVAVFTTRYGTGLSTAANTTNDGTNDAARYYGAATAIRISPNLMPAANTGRVRVHLVYYELTPPTS